MRKTTIGSVTVAILAGAAGVWAAGAGGAGAGSWEAEATLRDAWGTKLGTVSFEGEEEHTAVRLKLNGTGQVPAGLAATDAFHGFHIHANDNPANGAGCVADETLASSTWFVAVDGHWKKDPGQNHSGNTGDLPSVLLLDDGTAELRFHTERFDPSELEGRAVILHARPDNFGNVPVGAASNQYTANSADALTATNNTGNAGDRIGCGVIELG
jgi:superoxide dismutase, Cu-Zn family